MDSKSHPEVSIGEPVGRSAEIEGERRTDAGGSPPSLRKWDRALLFDYGFPAFLAAAGLTLALRYLSMAFAGLQPSCYNLIANTGSAALVSRFNSQWPTLPHLKS